MQALLPISSDLYHFLPIGERLIIFRIVEHVQCCPAMLSCNVARVCYVDNEVQCCTAMLFSFNVVFYYQLTNPGATHWEQMDDPFLRLIGRQGRHWDSPVVLAAGSYCPPCAVP